MSKKLKKKLEELCGLNDLDWEARQERANQILVSTSWKQQLCNELQGLSFRELEQFLSGVASERQKKEESYKRKLEVYNDRLPKQQKPMRRDTVGTQLPRRTLQEILAQVYAPRVVLEPLSPEERERIMGKRTGHTPEVPSDSHDVDDSTGE